MRISRSYIAVAAAVGLSGFANAASASGINFFTSNGPASGATVDGFNGQVLSTTTTSVLNVGGGKLSLGDAQVVQGSSSGQYAAPWDLGTNHADTSKYISVYGGGTATFTLAPKGSGAEYIGLEWGSIDPYNSITFESETAIVNAHGKVTGYAYTPVETFTGSQIDALANGNQGPGGTLYANFTSSSPIYQVIFSTSANSFEFDKLAFDVNPVPLPGALPLLASVLAGFGGAGWWRNRRAARSA
jgi:hypothetical protein